MMEQEHVPPPGCDAVDFYRIMPFVVLAHPAFVEIAERLYGPLVPGHTEIRIAVEWAHLLSWDAFLLDHAIQHAVLTYGLLWMLFGTLFLLVVRSHHNGLLVPPASVRKLATLVLSLCIALGAGALSLSGLAAAQSKQLSLGALETRLRELMIATQDADATTRRSVCEALAAEHFRYRSNAEMRQRACWHLSMEE